MRKTRDAFAVRVFARSHGGEKKRTLALNFRYVKCIEGGEEN